MTLDTTTGTCDQLQMMSVGAGLHMIGQRFVNIEWKVLAVNFQVVIRQLRIGPIRQHQTETCNSSRMLPRLLLHVPPLHRVALTSAAAQRESLQVPPLWLWCHARRHPFGQHAINSRVRPISVTKQCVACFLRRHDMLGARRRRAVRAKQRFALGCVSV